VLEDNAGFTATGHVIIRDKNTREILVDKFNAIHLGNLAWATVVALASSDNGHIRYMAFGNGGTRITSTGDILYRQPNVSNIRKVTDSLYNETFKKEIFYVIDNEVTPLESNSTYSDLRATVPVEGIESTLIQEPYDRAEDMYIDLSGDLTWVDEDGVTTTNPHAVFDELGLYVGPAGIVGNLSDSNDAYMITHLIFNPIQKSANRELQIEYTIRIQLT
jgi:hypothetical protein